MISQKYYGYNLKNNMENNIRQKEWLLKNAAEVLKNEITKFLLYFF